MWRPGLRATALSTVAVFTGNQPPRSSDEMCASYIFQD